MTAALVTNGGRSAWFVGVLLLMVYAVFAMTLYLLPPAAFVALTTLVISQGADAANYNRWNNLPPGYGYNTQANPNYGFGPVQRIQPTDVVSGNKIMPRMQETSDNPAAAKSRPSVPPIAASGAMCNTTVP